MMDRRAGFIVLAWVMLGMGGSGCDSPFCESNADCRAKSDFDELRYGICAADGDSCGPCPLDDQTECTSGTPSGSSSTTGEADCTPTHGACETADDCSCGQSCFQTALCSDCEKRCNFPCTTDEDCIELSADLLVKYGRCEKTSPSAEIYACEP